MQKTVKFSRNDPQDFFRTLRGRINGYFKDNKLSKTGSAALHMKAGIMLLWFFIPLAIVYAGLTGFWLTLLCYAVAGVGMAGVGFCVLHDAIHGSFSKNKTVNTIMGYSMNLIGGSSFTWTIQHNVLHHTYTNIYPCDEDINDKPFLRLSPAGKLRGYHKFQHIYGPMLYSLATLSWVFMKDFKQWVSYTKSGNTKKFGFNPGKELAIMIFSKLMYLLLTIALPLMLGVDWLPLLLGFMLMHAVAGTYLTTIFQLAHVVQETDHFAYPSSGSMDNIWAIHQLSTTANFSCKNPITTWMVGGLNFQVEHHLFPTISHVHYPKLSEIVKTTAHEFGVPYHEYKRIYPALVSHLKQLRFMGSNSIETPAVT